MDFKNLKFKIYLGQVIFKFSAKNWIAYGTFLLEWVCEQNKFWSLGYLDLHQLMTKPLFPSWASPMHSRNLMIYSIMNSQETGEMRRQKKIGQIRCSCCSFIKICILCTVGSWCFCVVWDRWIRWAATWPNKRRSLCKKRQ